MNMLRFLMNLTVGGKVGFMTAGTKGLIVPLVFILSLLPMAIMDSTAQVTRCDPNRYRIDPRVRKNIGREALLKAMELNTRVEAMIQQGSDEFDKMAALLEKSYSQQVTAIGAIEGLNREACFKDPLIDQVIKEMYGIGKPQTMAAGSAIKSGNSDAALEALLAAKRVHSRFMTFMY